MPRPRPSPTLNSMRNETSSSPAPTLAPLIFDLGPLSKLSPHSTGPLDRTNLPAEPDLSPIRWRLRLKTPEGRLTTVDCLCDNGAHGLFLSKDIADSLKLELIPVDRPTSVRLPDGTLLPILHRTRPLTSELDRQYKADLTYLVLPLKGIGVILGMPWLHRHGALIDHKDKTVKFQHRGREVLLHPVNPVLPPPLVGPLSPDPPWYTKAPLLAISRPSTSRPPRLAEPPNRRTHVPVGKEAQGLMVSLRAHLKEAEATWGVT
jgi:hypothetical protein